MMETPSILLCHGMYGKLDAMLAEESIYGPNGWCHDSYTSPVNHQIDPQQERDDTADIEGHHGCTSLFDEDSILKRQHFRILSPCPALRERENEGLDNSLLALDYSGREAKVVPGSLAVSYTDKAPRRPLTTISVHKQPSDHHHHHHHHSKDVVLHESIMEELQDHLPFSKRGESFWLQYSLVRDGASLDLLLNKVRDSEYTILAIETLEGEVFGAFCARPWKHANDYYGSGQSFLWRVEGSTGDTECNALADDSDSDLDDDEVNVQVFKFAFCNHNIQLCQPDRLVVGGGAASHHSNPPPSLAAADSISASSSATSSGGAAVDASSSAMADWGFGLWLEHDLLRGSSSPCLTFQSPSLSRIHEDGSLFEIRNLEVWSLTPCISVAQAEATRQQRRVLSGTLVPRALSLMATTPTFSSLLTSRKA